MCWLRHKWRKWTDRCVQHWVRQDDNRPQPGVVRITLIQERRCAVCNKIQTRSVEV